MVEKILVLSLPKSVAPFLVLALQAMIIRALTSPRLVLFPVVHGSNYWLFVNDFFSFFSPALKLMMKYRL